MTHPASLSGNQAAATAEQSALTSMREALSSIPGLQNQPITLALLGASEVIAVFIGGSGFLFKIQMDG